MAVEAFEGNKAETKTLIPVLTRFRDRHQAHDIVVVADAGMLYAANLLALEDNGFRFIVGSRTGKIPYELEAHAERHGNYLADGATIETTRRMGAPGRRRVTGEWSTTTRSNAPSTTTRRSTPWSNAPKRSPPANAR